MKLTSKLLLFFIPILVISLAWLGLWSYWLAEQAAIKKEYQVLDFVLEQVVIEKIASKYQVLENNDLLGIGNFEAAYKKEIFEELSMLHASSDKHFHILDKNTQQTIFTTNGIASFTNILLQWQDMSKVKSGMAKLHEKSVLFSVAEYAPWGWTVITTESLQSLLNPLARIREITFLATLFVSSLSSVLIWLVLNRIVVAKIKVLFENARNISKNKSHITIPINTKDEFSDLSNEMENMSLEIEKSISASKAASVAKTEFLATMSHEIRTPLNGVLGMTTILSRTELDAQQLELVDNLLKSTHSLTDLINDVLDLSKIEAGKLILETDHLNINDLVQNVNSVFQAMAVDNDVMFNCHSRFPKRYLASCDATRVRQIVFNIVGNAVKFTQKGSVNLALELVQNGTKPKNFLVIKCQDTGIGIAPDKLKVIFDSFTQADNSTTRHFGGSGLGLSIVQQLVELMHGHIDVQSELGNGSTFTVSVPIELSLADTAEIKTFENAEHVTCRPLTILLAEDQLINRTVASHFVENFGHQVFCALDGELAVKAVQKHNFDLILMDIHMPNMDGLQATKTIRALGGKYAELPIIGLTAEAFESRHAVFKQAGMQEVIIKPIEEKVLFAALERVAANKLASEALKAKSSVDRSSV